MVKLIESSQFADVPEIGAKFAEFSSPAMSKEAETIFGQSYDSLKPTDDRYVGIHLTALGDEETYGPNRNSDSFPKEACVKYHDTFVKHGHVFWRHHNDAEKDEILGTVKASAYNDKMGRVELFIWADKDKAKAGLDTLEKTGECSFSMACFRTGAPVLTSTGFKPIESVDVGDYVMSHTGAFRRVTALMSRTVQRYVRVGFVSWGQRVMEVTENHPVLVASFDDLPRGRRVDGVAHPTSTWRLRHRDLLHTVVHWKPAGQLTKYDYACVPIPALGDVAEGDICWARLCGYYVADGCISGKHGNPVVNFACGVHNALVDEVGGLAQWASVTKRKHHESDKAWSVNCYGKSIAERIMASCGRRCENKRIPPEIFAGTAAERINFAAAWFNSDGWQDKSGLHWSIHPRDLANALQVLLASLHIPTSCTRIVHPEVRGSVKSADPVEYVVTVSNEYSSLFAGVSKACEREIFGVSKLRTFVSGGYLMVPVASVETVEAESTVYNITVDRDESYTVYGLAVHNCRVPWDECSVCGVHRKNNQDPNMCDHIRHGLGKVAENGKVAFMRNVLPDFFDISFVPRPADRIAYSLKVASGEAMTSEMLAKAAGVVEPPWLDACLAADKHQTVRALADQYDDYARSPDICKAFGPVAKAAEARVDDATIDTLRRMPIKEAMAFLVDNGTFLGPDAFCRYAMGPKSAEYAEVGPRAAEVGRLAAQAIKEAAWLGRFDFTGASDFDVDRFTTRPSRRFSEVAAADACVKQASFTSQDVFNDLIVSAGDFQKVAGAHIDGARELCFNTIDKPILATALKYAEYKVSTLTAALNGGAQVGASNTNRDALLALVAAQDL